MRTLERLTMDAEHNPGPYPHPALCCAECGEEYAPGLNTDFCSEACETTWRAAHIRPCPECDGDGQVEFDCCFVGGTPTRAVMGTCPTCHGEGEVQS